VSCFVVQLVTFAAGAALVVFVLIGVVVGPSVATGPVLAGATIEVVSGGAVLAVASVGPIRKTRPAEPRKPHRHWFGGRRDGRLPRRFEQE
jgi:hypothetical protein